MDSTHVYGLKTINHHKKKYLFHLLLDDEKCEWEREREKREERERTQEGNLERYFNTRDYQSKLTKLGSLKSFSPWIFQNMFCIGW